MAKGSDNTNNNDNDSSGIIIFTRVYEMRFEVKVWKEQNYFCHSQIFF